jgi:hypothetical protein
MSERTDRIENALGSDWATTRQIAESAGLSGSYDMNEAYHALRKLEKYGRAERRVTEGGPSGRVAEWRRRP